MSGLEQGRWFGAKNLPVAMMYDEAALRSYLTHYAQAEGCTVAEDAVVEVAQVRDMLDPDVTMAVGRIWVDA